MNLFVVVRDGKNLQAAKGPVGRMNTMARMDPYCEVSLGRTRLRTSTHYEGGVAPQWGEMLAFEEREEPHVKKTAKPCNVLQFAVKEKEPLGHDRIIGVASLPLHPIVTGAWKFDGELTLRSPTEDAAWQCPPTPEDLAASSPVSTVCNSPMEAGRLTVSVMFEGWEARQPRVAEVSVQRARELGVPDGEQGVKVCLSLLGQQCTTSEIPQETGDMPSGVHYFDSSSFNLQLEDGVFGQSGDEDEVKSTNCSTTSGSTVGETSEVPLEIGVVDSNGLIARGSVDLRTVMANSWRFDEEVAVFRPGCESPAGYVKIRVRLYV